MKLKSLLVIVLLAGTYLFGDALDDGFAEPPNSAKPQVWWHWIHGNVTREGIKADLEAMRDIGIGGATILDIWEAVPFGGLKTCSPEWYDMIQYALETADKLGLEMSLHNCPGWSSCGGPWVTKENAMKTVTMSETTLDGGRKVSLALKEPPKQLGFYRDIAVLAFPSLPGDGESFDAMPNVKASCSLPGKDARCVITGKEELVFPAGKGPHFIQLDFAKPFQAATLTVTMSGSVFWYGRMTIKGSEDGREYRVLHDNALLQATENGFGFDPKNWRSIRLEFSDSIVQRVTRIGLHRNSLVPFIGYKFGRDRNGRKYYGVSPTPSSVIPQKDIIDLTSQTKNGRLEWNAPAGRWTVVRFGYTLTGSKNHPVPEWGTGLECDKMSKKAVKSAWDGMMARIVKRSRNLKSLKGTLIDSYEAGPQNWTDAFPEEFRHLRGYDCIRLLPILTGRYVESQDFTERFLADYRRTIADLFADCAAGYFSQLAHEAGLTFMYEPYGGPFDTLRQGRYADIPMGEFWGGGMTVDPANASLAGNLAQVNGRRFAGMESFSATPTKGRWQSHPAIHKAQGDNVFACGVNRLIFHDYAHQPWDCKGPGMTMGQWGFHFNRHNTLWKDYTGWLTYLSRAQFMLQQGRVVSDALYVGNEDVPCDMPRSPKLPEGYHANYVDPQAFCEQVANVPNGRIGFAHGLTFPLLIVNETTRISPAVLWKVKGLVENGATVLLGPRPQSSFGLENYPACDQEITALTAMLWGKLDGKVSVKRRIGKGTVYFGVSPQAVFDDMKLKPDFTAISATTQNLSIKYLHRQLDSADVYFVANTQRQPASIRAVFRQTGRVPELWDAVTGKKADAPLVMYGNQETTVELNLQQSESVFVVFRKKAAHGVNATSASWKTTLEKNHIVIHQAAYRAKDGSKKRDVTARLAALVSEMREGASVSVTNATLGGDPAPGRVKELVVDYSWNGKRQSKTFAEKSTVDLSIEPTDTPRFDVHREDDGVSVTAWERGICTLTMSDGTTRELSFQDVPMPLTLSGPWTVEFPAGWDAPASCQFPELASYTTFDQEGIKYFSGTATYRKSFDLPADWASRPLQLDLGTVMVMARVTVNGTDCGLLWQPPYRLDLTPYVHPGRNDLEIRVTNRWVNRLIGDEQKKDDCRWGNERPAGGRALYALPDWFLKGQKSPTGRLAFTTYKHWTKDDPLLPAGLIGPVVIRAGQTRK